MEKMEMIFSSKYLLVSLMFFFLGETAPSPTKKEEPVTKTYDYNNDFYSLDGLPTPAKDGPIGPHNELEMNNSINILDRLNNNDSSLYQKLTTIMTMTIAESISTENTSLANNSMILNTTIYPTTYNLSEGQKNVSSSFNISTPSTKLLTPKTKIPQIATNPSTQSTVLTTISPKMPATTSSSSVHISSPGVKGTLDPKRERVMHHPVLFFLLPFVIAGGVAGIILLGSYLRKKIKLDKLRHQLMPLYSFDPAEGEDWETELLTEPRANTQPTAIAAKATSPGNDPPKLRFAPDTIDV